MDGLSVQGVTHTVDGQQILKNVGFEVRTGELVCLLGPSGCGKTTMLRMIAGLEPLQAGQISIDDKLVAGRDILIPTEKRDVGFVFQDIALFPHLDVLNNVAFGLGRFPQKLRKTIAEAALARVGMAGRGSSFPHMLSGGEQQRVSLARALAPRPKLLLLDEPFSGLDVNLRARIRTETTALLHEMGTTAVMVTHDPDEALAMADRIAVMRQGEILQFDTPDGIFSHPLNAFCATFFGETNVITGQAQDGMVSTVLGDFPAEGIADGVAVEILVRPEGIQLAAAHNTTGIPAAVKQVRSLGASVQATFMLDNFSRPLLAKMHPQAHLCDGEHVTIAVDPAMAFVFPERDR